MTKAQRQPLLRAPDRMPALTAALADLTAHGEQTPCAGRDEWISDNRDDIETAKAGCASCPILEVCRPLGSSAYAGVWGGRRHRKGGPTTDDPADADADTGDTGDSDDDERQLA